jgi:hypothetical protein
MTGALLFAVIVVLIVGAVAMAVVLDASKSRGVERVPPPRRNPAGKPTTGRWPSTVTSRPGTIGTPGFPGDMRRRQAEIDRQTDDSSGAA